MLYSFVCNPVHIFYLFTSFSRNHPRLSQSPQPSSSVPFSSTILVCPILLNHPRLSLPPQPSSSVPFSSTILVCPILLNRPFLALSVLVY